MKRCPYCNGAMANKRRVQCGADACHRAHRALQQRQWQAAYKERTGSRYHLRYAEQRREAAAAYYQRTGWTEYRRSLHQQRRAAQAGVEAERIRPRHIFIRDGWRCGICRQSVDPSLKYPDPESASLDHVVPLAEGGAHTAANVQCSHLSCNLRKNRRGGGEQLALVG